MKKFFAIGIALFTFCVFFGFGMFALLSNTFGIDIERDGLFPTLTVTVLDRALIDYDLSFDLALEADEQIPVYTVVNNTDDTIDLGISTSLYKEWNMGADINTRANGLQYEVVDNEIILSNYPFNHQYLVDFRVGGAYDISHKYFGFSLSESFDETYYLDENGELINGCTDSSCEFIFDDEGYEHFNQDRVYSTTEYENIRLEAGESYEIKLSK